VTKTADAVVIGAGVTGASITFHLAKLGLKVIYVEKQRPAGGATGKSSAIVRMHYDNEPEVRMAFASLPYFQQWEDVVGADDCGYRVMGFLRLVDPEDSARLVANVRMMHRFATADLPRGLIPLPTLTSTANEVSEVNVGLWFFPKDDFFPNYNLFNYLL